MTIGPVPDESPINLQEQLLLEEAQRGEGKIIFNGLRKPLRYAPQLVANYGGSPEDWDKMTTKQSAVIDGASVQVHWYQNNKTGQNVEFKFKREYPKTAPRNQ
ncbi:MAG: hypothetical protein SXA11_16765 [Cyanobacteriota bacterium]|nr:hypothetical protein [Cyanobacteriota bacterium]